MMDFSKFRGSGDLSDITVIIQNHEHKLHKFPFYARSDYFCELARSKPERESEHVCVELNDFPGGNETFGQVADFCYNMPLEITKTNVVALRCAAEYLKMFGLGNLTEKTDKYLASTVASAKMVKSTASMVALLTHCNSVGDMAQKTGIVDTLVEALVDCWRKTATLASAHKGTTSSKTPLPTGGVTSAFTRVSGALGYRAADRLDEVSLDSLTTLRADWIANILTRARTSGISNEALGSLAVRYITCVLDIKDSDHGLGTVKSEEKVSGEEESLVKDTDSTKPGSPEQHLGSEEATNTPSSKEAKDIGYILDKIVMALPEQAFSIPSVTMDWLTKVLRVATSHNCACRGHLVRVAGEMLTHLCPEDLCVISPMVLHDIVADASQAKTDDAHDGNDGKPDQEGDSDDAPVPSTSATGLHGERACRLVDTYMSQMVAKGALTSETFKLLSSATKNYPRPSHDSLFEVLLFVIKSEKETLTPQVKSELTEQINFNLLSETSLKHALDCDVIPVGVVAESALQLCSRLRSELQSVKYIAEMQEEDIQKYQNNTVSKLKVAGVHGVHGVTGSIGVSGTASPPLISDARHAQPTFSERARIIKSGYADDLGDEGDENKPQLDPDSLRSEDVMSPEPLHPYSHSSVDPLSAAQGVLNAARHKLALPMYTGYRPARYSPTSYGTHLHTTPRRGMEHDISLEEELEFKFDRTFRSLDPRVRHQRLGGHGGHSGHRTYFPYSNHTHRF